MMWKEAVVVKFKTLSRHLPRGIEERQNLLWLGTPVNVTNKYCTRYCDTCRLGGVVVSVLAAGPKGCDLEPGQGDGF
jgi:hypothetical protein